MGAAPVCQPESSKFNARHAVVGEDASRSPLKYFQAAWSGSSVRLCCDGLPTTEARQFPPRLLSNAGLTSSMESPGGSPTVGHGKPSRYSTSSCSCPRASRRTIFSPLLLSVPDQGTSAFTPNLLR